DLANTVFSLGQDRLWRRAAAQATGLADGEVAVDVACGTGALAEELATLAPGASVVGLDFSWEMVRRAGTGAAGPRFAVADALRLPLADGSVDVVTIAFGLRNLPEPARGLLEFRRVLRTGGPPGGGGLVAVAPIAFALRNRPEPARGLLEFRRVLRTGGRLAVCEFSHPTVP